MYVTLKLGDNECCRIHSVSDDGNGWIVTNERYVVMPWKMVTRHGKSMTHDLLKSRMNNIINNAFKHKNGATRCTHIKAGRNKSHFTSDPLNGDNKYTANDICKMTEFLVDNIYIRFGGQLFRQMVGIPMGTNCAPLLADLFLYSCENEFLDRLIKEGKRKLARRFNLSYRYIDDLISFNNKRFKEFISDIYPKELTISETTESTSVASYLDLLFT